MLENIERNFVVPNESDFDPYLKRDSKLPPLDKSRLRLDLACGDPRGVKAPTTGNATLVVVYKGREGVLSSFEAAEEEISVLQLQGAREGYRITSGLNWVQLFADRIVQIAQHPDNGVRRLVMPVLLAIEGFTDARELAMGRYEQFAARAGLIFSAEEKLLVRDIQKT